MNLYGYVGNDPVKAIDPLGERARRKLGAGRRKRSRASATSFGSVSKVAVVVTGPSISGRNAGYVRQILG